MALESLSFGNGALQNEKKTFIKRQQFFFVNWWHFFVMRQINFVKRRYFFVKQYIFFCCSSLVYEKLWPYRALESLTFQKLHFVDTLSDINYRLVIAFAAPKKRHGKVALGYCTSLKRLIPHFPSCAQPPWKVQCNDHFNMKRSLLQDSNTIYNVSKFNFSPNLWNLLFWAYNVVIFLLLIWA